MSAPRGGRRIHRPGAVLARTLALLVPAICGAVLMASASARRAPGLETLRPQHVALSVPDLDESVRWYRDVLGFRLVVEREFAQLGTRAANLERNGFQVELFERAGAMPVPNARREPFVDDLLLHGVKHVGFVVDDLDAAVRELRAKGVRFASEPAPVPELGLRLVFIHDNNGYLIELGERLP